MKFPRLKKIAPILWADRVTIYTTRAVKHGAFTEAEQVTICKDEPAKIILKGQNTSVQTFYGTDHFDAILLLDNTINIPAGSTILVTDQNGTHVKYKRSSKGYTGYYSHQEIALERDEKA